MTSQDDTRAGDGGDDILAAEYVLGVLPQDERGIAARRIEDEATFARLVEAWQGRLSPLDSLYPEVAPPDAVRSAIHERLFGHTMPPVRSSILHSLRFWRGLAAASLAGLLVVGTLPLLRDPAPEFGPRLVASLGDEAGTVGFLAVYDGSSGEIGLSRLADERGADQDFELWVIEGDQAPVSLGVVPEGESVRIVVAPEQRALLSSGGVFAVSLEPAGGSPTGQPTGPVIASGPLRAI